jgi:AraC-like DNA-binding protein
MFRSKRDSILLHKVEYNICSKYLKQNIYSNNLKFIIEEDINNFIQKLEQKIYSPNDIREAVVKFNDNLKIYQIAEMVVYSNSKYFCKVFKKYIGLSPGNYLRV